MHRLFQTAIVFLALTGSALADSPVRIQEPAKFCDDLFANISPFKADQIAKKVATTVGKVEFAETIANAMKILDDKKVDFSKKVLDKDFGGALRQIIYYAYVDNFGFVYFRLNFKMTSTGWILASFNFKSETNELFPKDFVEHWKFCLGAGSAVFKGGSSEAYKANISAIRDAAAASRGEAI